MSGNPEQLQENATEELHTATPVETYPSSELLLSLAQKEYDTEFLRKNHLETKSGILLTLAAALLTFLTSNLEFKKISFPVESIKPMVLYSSYILFTIMSFITLGFSIFYLLKTFLTNQYAHIPLGIFTNKNGGYSKDETAMSIVSLIVEAIKKNEIHNNNKTKAYKFGTYCLFVALITTLISYAIFINL